MIKGAFIIPYSNLLQIIAKYQGQGRIQLHNINVGTCCQPREVLFCEAKFILVIRLIPHSKLKGQRRKFTNKLTEM